MVIIDTGQAQIDDFYDCFSELMSEGYGHFSPGLRQHFLTVDYPKKNFQFWLERSVRKILLAKEGSETLGFLVGDYAYGGVGFVSWLGIRNKYRGKGFGTELYNEYEKFIKTKNAHLIELFTFAEVKPFYEKLGFKEIGRREEGYFGQKNVIMDKKIGEWVDLNLLVKK